MTLSEKGAYLFKHSMSVIPRAFLLHVIGGKFPGTRGIFGIPSNVGHHGFPFGLTLENLP